MSDADDDCVGPRTTGIRVTFAPEFHTARGSIHRIARNFTDCIREARRCLHLDGWLHIWEAADYFDDVDAFCAGVRRLGFDVLPPEKHGRLLCIRATKNTTTTAAIWAATSRGS